MNRNLIFIAISLFTWGLGESAFLPFQPLYLQQLGADPIQIGGILGGFGLVAMLAHLPAGYLADRFGRRPIMWAAWIIGAVATWLMALASALPGFVTGMLLYGFTMFVMAPLNSYITTARGSWSVGRAITLISATYNAGAIIGPTLGGAIGERFGYRPIFLFSAVTFILSTLLIFLVERQPVDPPSHSEDGQTIFHNRRYLVFLGVYFLALFAMILPQSLAPNFLQNERLLNLAQIGQLTSIASIGIVLLSLLLGRLEARTGYLIGMAGVGIFALLLWQGNGMLLYGIAYFVLGGFRPARALATAHIRSLVSAANMGIAFGLAETTGALALVLAPILAGYLYDQQPLSIYMLSVVMVAGALLANSVVIMGKSVD